MSFQVREEAPSRQIDAEIPREPAGEEYEDGIIRASTKMGGSITKEQLGVGAVQILVEDGRAVGTEPVPCTQYLGDGPYPAGPPRAGTKKSAPATAAGGLAIKVLIAAAVVVAACCCCAMAVGLGTAATLGREEDDDDPPEQVREIQLHGLRPWKAPDGDNVVVGG